METVLIKKRFSTVHADSSPVSLEKYVISFRDDFLRDLIK